MSKRFINIDFLTNMIDGIINTIQKRLGAGAKVMNKHLF